MLSLNQPVHIEQLNVFYAAQFPWSMGMTKVDAAIQECVLKATEFLRSRGGFTQPLVEKIPNIDEVIEISMVRLTDLSMFDVLKNEDDTSSSLALEVIKSHFGLSNFSRAICEFELIRRFRGFVRPSKLKYWEDKGVIMETELLVRDLSL